MSTVILSQPVDAPKQASQSGRLESRVNASPKSPTLKRKRDERHETVYQPFDVLPCPYSHLDRPVRAQPVFLLPRSALPLSSIDPCAAPSRLPRSRFFSAYVDCLEQDEDATATPQNYSILITRVGFDACLYAVERVRTGVYSFCRLGSWVDVHQLRRAIAKPTYPLISTNSIRTERTPDASWWSPCAIEPILIGVKRRKIGEVLGIEETTSAGNAATECDQPLEANAAQTSSGIAVQRPSVPSILPDAPQSPSSGPELLESIIKQYLEALYLSNASLAYFAKGPLSKARVVHAECGTLPMLSEDLRSLILSTTLADKRYRETLPEALKTSEDTGGHVAGAELGKKKPKKRPKTLRRAKNGLLPGEEEILSSWWASDQTASTANASFESAFRQVVPQIRFRETLLQLLLILEVLSLESAVIHVEQPVEGDVQISTESQADGKNAKPKKPKDLETLAETLVDRLTIWQSLEAAPGEADEDASRAQGADQGAPSTARADRDRLKDFCVDAVQPFFASRLPTLVGKLSKKMGVRLFSPQKQHRVSRASSDKPAPGTAISRGRPTTIDHRKPLSRVASDAALKNAAKMPALLRSATESSLHEIKRERSSTPRSDVSTSRPLSRSGSITTGEKPNDAHRRRSLSRVNSINKPNRSFNQREVDLSAITKYNEAKAKKKLDVEKELKDAIATLKKPNRGMAVKEITDEAEARSFKVGRSSVAQRKPHGGPQVDATPKRVNKQSVLATPDRAGYAYITEPENIPSTNPVVPASIVRPSHDPFTRPLPTSTQARRRSSGFDLSETPVRRVQPLRLEKQHDAGVQPPSLRHDGVFATPAKSRTAVKTSPATHDGVFVTPAKHHTATPTSTLLTTPKAFAVPSTPSKTLIAPSEKLPSTLLAVSKSKENRNLPATPEVVAQVKLIPTESIYATLGWDD